MSDEQAVCSLSGNPLTDDHREINPATGMQKDYKVLCPDERAKGFVRPYRDTYRHLPCGMTTTMGRALAETFARDPHFYSGTFCATCRTHYPLDQFVWMDGRRWGRDMEIDKYADACVHGHTSRVVGCVSCVLVFDREDRLVKQSRRVRKLVSIDEACSLTDVCRRTVYTWMKQGKLEYVRTAGGSVRIYEDTLWRPGEP